MVELVYVACHRRILSDIFSQSFMISYPKMAEVQEATESGNLRKTDLLSFGHTIHIHPSSFSKTWVFGVECQNILKF